MSTMSESGAETRMRSDDRPNKHVVSRLITCQKEGGTAEDLGTIIKADPVLCYALFAELGSTGAVLTSYVSSARQAIEIMTLPVFGNWVQTALEYADAFQKFSHAMRETLIRARFLELMGHSVMGREDTEDLYLVGLFSRLHRMLKIPLAELILPLPLSEEMRMAILEQAGRIGRLLKFAETIENADEHGMDFMQTNLRLPSVQVYDAYNEAYDWVSGVEAQYTGSA